MHMWGMMARVLSDTPNAQRSHLDAGQPHCIDMWQNSRTKLRDDNHQKLEQHLLRLGELRVAVHVYHGARVSRCTCVVVHVCPDAHAKDAAKKQRG
jgi:hypothetical protein